MKISNRERIMIFILGIILIGFGYYNFVYSVQTTKVEEKLKEENQVKEKYETAKTTIDSLENKKNDVELLKVKIEDKSTPFYPIISEEHIILEIDQLLKDSQLKGTIKFDPIVCDSVGDDSKSNKSLPQSTLQPIVDKYNNNDITTDSSDKNNKNDSNANASKDKKKDTVQYVKFQVNFQGTYDGIYKFLSAIGENEKKIIVNSIKLSSDTSNGIKGTVNLEIYSIPKINDELEEYLKWTLNNSYGKDVPFAPGTANQSVNSTASESVNATAAKQQETKIQSDFIVSVKSITSDLPKIIIGKAKDSLRTTYVYADSNSQEQAEMIFTQDGDKYYYKYKTSKGTFPANYDGIGEEFIPTSKDIILNILSESRVDANDNSGIRLKIVNKTDKSVDVSVIGDDSTNPRVVVDWDGSNVSVNKN